MVKVFEKMSNKTTTDVVEDTLKVDANGNVTFRASLGKGSGRPINIPGDQFDTFVSLLTETANRRKELAKKAAGIDEVVVENTNNSD